MPYLRGLSSYDDKPLHLDALVKRTSNHYVAIGEHSDLYTGIFVNDDGSKLAIKVLRGATSNRDDFRETFSKKLTNAAKTWKTFNNAHVAKFYGIAYDQGLMPALVLTYYPLGNIIDYIKKQKVSFDSLPGLVKDIAEGLNYLHTRDPPVIHGDLRGNNVLIDHNGRAVISDYGLAFIIQSSDFTSVKTAGTCRWTAPEIMNPPEDSSPDAPSVPYSLPGDIYALGMTIVEIYTGKAPFYEKKNDSAVIFMVIDRKRPDLPSEIEKIKPLKSLVESCWAQDPRDRPSSTQVIQRIAAVGVYIKRILYFLKSRKDDSHGSDAVVAMDSRKDFNSISYYFKAMTLRSQIPMIFLKWFPLGPF